MRFPSTDEGWSALATVVSAITAFLNLIFLAFLARYTIRQTAQIEKQADASTVQTRLLLKSREGELYRETYFAHAMLFKVMNHISLVQEAVLDNCVEKMPVGPIRPVDWHLTASCLIAVYKMEALPSQMDVEMNALDEAIMELRSCRAQADIDEATRKVMAALKALLATVKLVIKRFSIPLDPDVVAF